MPRSARIVLPNYPHHVIQRGHNCQQVFFGDREYLYYLKNLKEWKGNLKCKIYSFCLMPNHIHLIIDPGPDVGNLALLIKHVSGRQTRYVNKRWKRRGTLWEGRYKSSPIKWDEYLMCCCRYIELNPVRAKIVSGPEEYKWSSYRGKTGGGWPTWIDKDPIYLGLSDNENVRQEKYKIWVKGSVPRGEVETIRTAVQRGQLTGSKKFIDEVDRNFGKRIEWRGRGRPFGAENK